MARPPGAQAQRAAGEPAKRAAGGPAKRAAGGSMQWLMGMACGAILAFATPAAILGGALLAPAILAAALDTQAKRPMTRVVFVACAGFVFGPLWHLYGSGGTMSQAMDMLYDPAVICPAWLAGACGWGLCEVLPQLIGLAAERAAVARTAALEAEAAAIRAEWDLEADGA